MTALARQLPIVFRPLDVEGKTKPVPLVWCPDRVASMTVGICGRCQQFSRVEFTELSRPVLACGGRSRALRSRKPHPRQVVELARVPLLCVADDTPLGALLPQLDRLADDEWVPVLDRDARPIGLAPARDLRKLAARRVPLSTPVSLVTYSPPLCVFPDTTLDDARQMVAAHGVAVLVVVAPDGTFLGMLGARDLMD